MIYIVEEHWLNGTVTMGSAINGIEAETFLEAVTILKAHLADKEMRSVTETEHAFTFHLQQPYWESMGMRLGHAGTVTDVPLRMLEPLQKGNE